MGFVRLRHVFLMGFPAAALATNCYVIAPGVGGDAVVVDPGVGVLDPLARLLREHELRPVAVLLTHGHLDHVYSAAAAGRALGGPAVRSLVHTDDLYRLDDPTADLDPAMLAMFAQQFGQPVEWTRPEEVETFTDGARLDLAGLEFAVAHAPGHTEGSALFTVEGVPDALGPDTGLARTILSGDVLFNGSVGRTDLPGGDPAAMTASLRDVVRPMPGDSLVLPGHGPATTIERERATNPYLQGLPA